MTDIVKLVTGKVEMSQDVIEFIEFIRERAQAGEIVSMAYCAETQDGGVISGTSNGSACPAVICGLDMLRDRLKDNLLNTASNAE